MENYVSRFLRSSLIWLVIGTTLGAAMALRPVWAVYRTAHLHALLLGFVMMMIAGVAYHVIPRFTMAALHSPRLARLHVWVANIGLVLMVCGFLGRPHGHRLAPPVLAAGGLLSLAGAWMLAWNLWRTLDRAVRIPGRVPGGRPLPTSR
ncbi:MAG TPA: cbb3-type cytochrome c oxidase subunit I [Gemmatimonadales bacterium]|nr:cbb3-type cytochrome c oxidase subunit I [Gemmatimonadales bacterium]